VFSIALFACGTWTLDTEEGKLIFRKLLNAQEDLLQNILKKKLESLGHIATMLDNSKKIKRVVFGKMDGDNRKGKPYWEWLESLDDIKEWCQKDIHTT